MPTLIMTTDAGAYSHGAYDDVDDDEEGMTAMMTMMVMMRTMMNMMMMLMLTGEADVEMLSGRIDCFSNVFVKNITMW